jgi:hypothetical protein
LEETGQSVSFVPESRGSAGCRLLQAVKMNSGLVEICDGAVWRPREDFLALLRLLAFAGIVALGRREGSPI